MKVTRIAPLALVGLGLAARSAFAQPVVVSTAANAAAAPAASEAAQKLDDAAHASRMGDRKAALAALAEAEKLKPTPIVLRQIALAYQDINEFPRARALIKTLLKTTPSDAQLQIDLASIETRADDRAGALKSLAKARDLKPDLSERHRMVRLYRHFKSYADAKSLLEGMIADFPADADLRIDRAALAAEMGEAQNALDILIEARKLDAAPAARHRMAILHQELKDYAGALSLLEPLAKDKPEAAILGDLGVCKHLAGRSEEAISDLSAAIKLDGKYLPPYLTLATIYQGRKEFDKELAVYESAPVDDGDPALKELLQKGRQAAAARAAAAPPPTPAPPPVK